MNQPNNSSSINTRAHGAGLQKRKVQYTRQLTTDRDRPGFDDKVADYLKEVLIDPDMYIAELQYLDSIGWKQSKYEWAQIDKQLSRFKSHERPSFVWNDNFGKAKADMMREVSNWRLKTYKYTGIQSYIDALPKKDSHAGFSYLETGKKEKVEYVEELHLTLSDIISVAKRKGTFGSDMLIGARTQTSAPYTDEGERKYEYKPKTRMVSMVDVFVIFAEIIFAKRLQTKMGTVPWYAGGKDDGQILNIINQWRRFYRYWLSIDYSNYDASIPSWLIRESFDIVRLAYDDVEWDEDLFKIIREDFIKKVYYIADSDRRTSKKGVPSGSMFTQIIDTIANMLMVKTYLYSIGCDDHKMIIMGDDNLIFTQVRINREDLSSYLERNFGIECHPDKCDDGDMSLDPKFLSKTWRLDGVWRHPKILLAKMTYPERYRDYNNTDLHPSMIVDSFISSYPMPMAQIINMSKHRMLKKAAKDSVGNERWLSGLAYFRANYAA